MPDWVDALEPAAPRHLRPLGLMHLEQVHDLAERLAVAPAVRPAPAAANP